MPPPGPSPSSDPSPTASYTMPAVHNGYSYTLYGRDATAEFSYALDAYAANSTKWASTNLTLTGALASQTVANSSTLKPMFTSNMGSAAIPLVPTTAEQLARLSEMALAAKAILDDPEIDVSANNQIAAGFSAAMGGGHNSVTALKDNISFEQKLQAKQLAMTAYTQALDAYYKVFTATGATLASTTSQGVAQSSLSIPTVAPFESQYASDLLAQWQDTLNTGQLRDQQIRQTYEAGTALDNFNPGTAYSAWNAEYALAWCGIKSQAAAAKAT